MKNSLSHAAHPVKRWFLNLYPIQKVILGYFPYIILGWLFSHHERKFQTSL
jgi:hypothetical protein